MSQQLQVGARDKKRATYPFAVLLLYRYPNQDPSSRDFCYVPNLHSPHVLGANVGYTRNPGVMSSTATFSWFSSCQIAKNCGFTKRFLWIQAVLVAIDQWYLTKSQVAAMPPGITRWKPSLWQVCNWGLPEKTAPFLLLVGYETTWCESVFLHTQKQRIKHVQIAANACPMWLPSSAEFQEPLPKLGARWHTLSSCFTARWLNFGNLQNKLTW